MKKAKYLFGFLIVLLITGPGCEPFSLNTDDLQISADFSIFKTYFSVNYHDAQTGEVVGLSGDMDLDIELIPSVENIVVNTEGDIQNSLHSKFGFFTLALDPYAQKPSIDNPITITIITHSNRFLDHVRTIKIGEERSLNYDFNLIDKLNLPSGVILEQKDDAGETSNTGETKENISLTTENNEVEVEIESGTILTDEDGAPLTGKVSVEMMSVDVTNEEGFNNVPGLDQPVITEDGSSSAMFNPIAYTKVEITDASGKKAKNVSGKEMTIITAVSSSIINPSTKLPIAPGDMVPSYYFDENSSSWIFSGQDVVEESDGKLVLKKTIKSMKSGGGTQVGQFGYTFDQDASKDYVIRWTATKDLTTLPIELHCYYELDYGNNTKSGKFNVLIDTYDGEFWLYGMPDISTGLHFLFDINGAVDLNALPFVQIGDHQGWDLNLDGYNFEESGSTDYSVNFRLNICDGYRFDGNKLPNFTAIFSGPGFSGETVKLISGGVITLPFDPRTTEGTWRAKIIFNNSFEYPSGTGRIDVKSSDFTTEGSGTEEKIIFTWTVSDPKDCADLKKALGIG